MAAWGSEREGERIEWAWDSCGLSWDYKSRWQRRVVISIRNMSTGYKLCQRQNDKKPLKGANNTARWQPAQWQTARLTASAAKRKGGQHQQQHQQQQPLQTTRTETTKGHKLALLSLLLPSHLRQSTRGAVSWAVPAKVRGVGRAWARWCMLWREDGH